jgi:hypothetical protein
VRRRTMGRGGDGNPSAAARISYLCRFGESDEGVCGLRWLDCGLDVERRHRQQEEYHGRRFFRIRKKIRANRYFHLLMALVGNLVFDRENIF